VCNFGKLWLFLHNNSTQSLLNKLFVDKSNNFNFFKHYISVCFTNYFIHEISNLQLIKINSLKFENRTF